MIIDVHTHLPAPEGMPLTEKRRQYLLDLRRDDTDYAIVIPDTIKHSPIGDLDECLQLFAQDQNISLLGPVDPEGQDRAAVKRLDDLMRSGRIVGMKVFPGHDPFYPNDQRLDDAYSICSNHHLPLMIHTGWNSGHPEVALFNDPKHILKVAKKHPSLPIVISHFFWPEIEYCYAITRGVPNIYFDTSVLADEEVLAATGANRIRDILLRAISDSPEAVLFGTDYLCCPRRPHMDFIESLPIDPDTKEKVFWRNAVRLLRLNVN